VAQIAQEKKVSGPPDYSLGVPRFWSSCNLIEMNIYVCYYLMVIYKPRVIVRPEIFVNVAIFIYYGTWWE
jgi:hypothetical protein